MKDFQILISAVKAEFERRDIDMTNIKVERDVENGRYYLSGEYEMPSAFGGVVTRNKHTKVEEVWRGNIDYTFELFCNFFSDNRAAYCKASDEEVLAFGLRHPDTYPVA